MSDDVLLRIEGVVGHITLNRPAALNALTHAMALEIDAQLKAWAKDDRVQLVLLDGAGPRGLCAGGDIRALYDASKAHEFTITDGFFHDEYRLNARIARYPKPYIALMTGIVMGGGIGLSAHAAHRVVSDNSTLAMPEVGIGFIPDVGGTYLLGTAPGELGTHAALTAGRLGAGDAILCRLADSFMPGGAIPDFTAALTRVGSAVEGLKLLASTVETAPAGVLAEARPWIDECYAADTVEEIVARLEAKGGAGPEAALKAIGGASPVALKVTLRALREARRLGRLEPCLVQEYRLARACMRSHDFVEGVRAQVVDKDRQPRWAPSRLADVGHADVDAYFGPIGGHELTFEP